MRSSFAIALHDVASLRMIEREAASALPPGTLMTRAGEAASRWIIGRHPLARCIRIWCGPGNNGGDGYACALALRARGRDAHCIAAAEPVTDDARQAAQRWTAAGGATLPPVRANTAPPPDLVVDALFGIGLARPLAPPWSDWVDAINRSAVPVLALDMPSGLDADRGVWIGGQSGIHASATVSFLGGKPGLFTADGVDACGQVVIDDLGITLPPSHTQLNAPDQFSALSAPRVRNSHKGRFGDVRVIGGAAGMCGAALLAGRAALRLGAGRVHVDLLDPALGVDPQAPELMLRNQPHGDLPASTAVVGCGLGVDAAGRAALMAALARAEPCVIDADGLTLIASDPQVRAMARSRVTGATTLTPHPLEAARLLGVRGADVQADRLQAARALAREFNAWIVLKGAGTIISGEGRTWINPTGSAALATAGSGDVLAGMIGALLAQGLDARCATLGAVWLHGTAADDYGADVGLVADEIAPRAAAALARLRRASGTPS
jgi:hydroxyethylthiazole kinase-like uncharacterized protein yjeF